MNFLLFFVLKCIRHANIFYVFNVSGRCEDVFVFALWIWSKLNLIYKSLLSFFICVCLEKAEENPVTKKLSSKEEEKKDCVRLNDKRWFFVAVFFAYWPD